MQVRGFSDRVWRLAIDTPETVTPSAPVERCGPEASARTKTLLPRGMRVTFVFDRYGRALAHVIARGDRDIRRGVNLQLVREG